MRLGSFSATLERPSQRQLDESWRTHSRNNLAERIIRIRRAGKISFDVRDRRIAEGRMIPDVEEVCREADRLPLGKTEVFEQGKVPVLLERSTINIPSQIAEVGSTEIWIAGALRWIEQRCTGEIRWVQVGIDTLVNVPARVPGRD